MLDGVNVTDGLSLSLTWLGKPVKMKVSVVTLVCTYILFDFLMSIMGALIGASSIGGYIGVVGGYTTDGFLCHIEEY
jgi:hypothetical protein